MFRPRRFLTLLLAISLAVAPLLSSAQAHTSGDNALSGMSAAEHAQHLAGMADHDDTGGSDAARCASHDACSSQCCVGCGHCTTTVEVSRVLSSPSHPVQSPVVLTLHLSRLPALQYRPPQG